MSFVHLHVHSEASFGDGVATAAQLAEAAHRRGAPAMAITDHNGLYGALRFYQSCAAAGVKPILGAEVVTEDGFHIVLLAETLGGYTNLCHLISEMHAARGRPNLHTSNQALEEHSEGLIALSGCPRGEIPSRLLAGDLGKAEEAAERCVEVFGEDNFFVELVRDGSAVSRSLAGELVSLAKRMGIGTVATNNVHFVRRQDAELRDLLLTMEESRRRPRAGRSDELYVKSAREMRDLFTDVPEAVAATFRIAERCSVDLDFRAPHLPRPAVRGNVMEQLEQRALHGLGRCFPGASPRVKQRLARELRMIERLGLADYFTILALVARRAEEIGILVDGSGPINGSLLSYLLGITHVDPQRHNLGFEGFTDPTHPAAIPTTELLVEAGRRSELLDYAHSRFDAGHAAVISGLEARPTAEIVRASGRAAEIPYRQVETIAQQLADVPAAKLAHAVSCLEGFSEDTVRKPHFRRFFDLARRLGSIPEGISPDTEKLVIADDLTDFCPTEPANGRTMTQYAEEDLSTIGFATISFTGSPELSVIKEALARANERPRCFLTIGEIASQDETFEMLKEGRTIGVSGLDDPLSREMLGRLAPSAPFELLAADVLFDPRPIEGRLTARYLARRSGRAPITYPHPRLEPMLRETYGVILYDEQLLLIASQVGNMSPQDAAALCGALAGDRRDERVDLTTRFLQGAESMRATAAEARAILGEMAAAAPFTASKAQAASRCHLHYTQAYLKTNFPAEYFVSLISAARPWKEVAGAKPEVGFYPLWVDVDEAKRCGIEFKAPHVNRSLGGDLLDGSSLQLGLGHIRGLLPRTVATIVAERERGGEYESVQGFVARTRATKPTCEKLIKVGALDGLAGVLEWRAEREFGREAELESERESGREDFATSERLEAERVFLGLYVSGHPIELLRRRLSELDVTRIADLAAEHAETKAGVGAGVGAGASADTGAQAAAGAGEQGGAGARIRVRLAGLHAGRQDPPRAVGRPRVHYHTIEDETGIIDIVTTTRTEREMLDSLATDRAVFVEGRVSRRAPNAVRVIADRVKALSDVVKGASETRRAA